MPKEKKKIVVIDDSSISLQVIENLLKEKYDVKCFSSPERGISYLMIHIPDLIILDMYMPTMKGIDVHEKIKTFSNLANAKILYLTTCNEKADIVKALSLGASGYVLKPLNTEDFKARIKELLA